MKPRSWMALLSLLAMLVSFVPQFAWACPMTGRIADSPAVCCCQKMRAKGGHSCAKPVSLPPDNSGKPALLSAPTGDLAVPLAPAPLLVAWALLPGTFDALAPPRASQIAFLSRPHNYKSPPAPALCAGRAPPLV